MSGRSRREERSCKRWATSSLPVPLSPVMSTVLGLSATFSIKSSTRRIAGDSPTICARPFSSDTTLAAPNWRVRAALAMTRLSSSCSKGFVT